MRRIARLVLLGSLVALPARGTDVIVAVGAPGEAAFAEVFGRQVERWREGCARGGREIEVLSPATRVGLEAAISTAKAVGSSEPLWLVLIGHGTFDGRASKFNLEGEDATPEDFSAWLEGTARPLVVVNTTAASAPFVDALSGEGRIIVTATKDASEVSFAHFGKYFAESVASPEADLDQDGATSLLEAFLVASRETKAFFDDDGRLATEEAVVDDNGDKRGTLAGAFDGLLSTQAAAANSATRLPDGVRAHQVSLVPSPEEAERSPEWKAERDRLELALFRLRARKDEMEEPEYLAALEAVLVPLGELYQDGVPPGATNVSE